MNSTTRALPLACLCLSLCPLDSARSQDWPQWRGPNRDARSSPISAPSTWPKELAQTWKIQVGEGVATPALVGDRLYVFSREEGREITRAIEAATGKTLWKDEYDSLGATGPASGFSGPRCSPTVVNGKIVTLGVRGVLSCLEAGNGKVLWRKDDFPGAWPRFFPSSSPIVADGLCVAQLGGPGNGGVVAYQLDTGAEVWRWTGDAPAYASPILATIDGAKLIVAQTDTKMVAFQLATGKLVWETAFAVQGRGYNAATPMVDGAVVLYGGSNRGTTAVRLKRQGDQFTGEELWSNPDPSVQFNSPVLKEGLVYGLTADNRFFCLDEKDGATLWTAPLEAAQPAAAPPAEPASSRGGRRGGGGMGRGGYGSIVDAGPVLLALTPASDLVVFEPSRSGFSELARYKVADSPTYAYPIASGKRLFIKDENSLILWTLP